MFTGLLKTDIRALAIERLKQVLKDRGKHVFETRRLTHEFFDARSALGEDTSVAIETYINSLPHTPREIVKTISEYRGDVQTFERIIDEFLKRGHNRLIDECLGTPDARRVDACLKAAGEYHFKRKLQVKLMHKPVKLTPKRVGGWQGWNWIWSFAGY